MKKWQRVTLSFGLASSLLVPSFASAAVTPDLNALSKKVKADMMKSLKLSNSEQKLLAYQKQQKQQQEKQEVLSTDTIIVKYDSKLSANIHRKSGARLERSLPSLGYDIVKLAKGQKMADLLTYYSKQAGVTSVSPSVTYSKLATGDPKAAQMYHLNYLEIDEAIQLAGDHEVTVAVIDTGMDIKHPELKSQVLPPYSVLNPSGQPILDVHGTHVAGIIAAEQNNGVGGHGVNPNAKILPIDVFGGGWGTSDFNIAEGILYAISKNVDVINMSLGGTMPSPLLEEAVKKAIDAGITVVAAAGNNYGEVTSYPAAYEGVISVSATNFDDELAEFSSYGSFVDISAPGEAVYNSIYDPYKGSTFAELSGTSMASPVVAGVASLLLSKYPDLKPFEVEAILKMTALDLGDEGYDVKFGTGFVDAVAALQFDMAKLPNASEVTEKDAKANAPEVTGDKAEWKNKIAMPGEMHWYKVKLEKGEGAQALLDGAKQFNYKMVFDFVPDSAKGKPKSRNVDVAPNGKQEAGFFQAKESGTLFVGVKDVYGHYDAESQFTLSLSKEKEMKIDTVTALEPVVISKLPFTSSEGGSTLTFAVDAEATEADKDYFRFKVEEPTMVKFDLSAVPGIDSAVGVYFEQDFFMEPPPDLPAYVYWEKPMIQYANSKGIGEGEQVTFEAMPGMDYLVEVAAEPKRDFWFEMMMGSQMGVKDKVIPNSNTPYVLKAETVEPAQDEDGFPVREMRPEEAMEQGEMTKPEYQEAKRAEFKAAMEKMAEMPYFRNFDEKMLELVKEKALPYSLGEKLEGKIQFGGDQDYYKFTADVDAIYNFELAEPKELLPWVQIMEYDAKNNDLFPIADIWTYGILWGENVDLTRTIALEKGKEYYIRVADERYQAKDESYVLTTKKLMDVPATNDHDENTDTLAKTLAPGQKAKNHLIYSTDRDFYYYKNRGEENFLSLTVKPQMFSLAELEKMPEELLNPLIAFVTIIEDTNGNMKIDGDEALKSTFIGPNQKTLNSEGSFKAKKDVGYFFELRGFGYDGGVSVQPYEIGLHNWNLADEDKNSVVKGNVPSAPLVLKRGRTGVYQATGHFNPGVDFGDKDYYKLSVDKYSKFDVGLETPLHMDGAITILDAKGKKVARMDHYGAGDFESGTVTLPKGNYYILIEESFGQTSLEGYKLLVRKK